MNSVTDKVAYIAYSCFPYGVYKLQRLFIKVPYGYTPTVTRLTQEDHTKLEANLEYKQKKTHGGVQEKKQQEKARCGGMSLIPALGKQRQADLCESRSQ